jgi:hypothetical protein
VIQALTEVAEKLAMNAALLALMLAGLITGFVLLAQSVVGWFEDRNPW